MKTIKISRFCYSFGLALVAGVTSVLAADPETATTAAGNAEILKWLALSSGLAVGMAAIGGALGQGKLVAQTMEGIARNPGASRDMFLPLILGLAFIEAVAEA